MTTSESGASDGFDGRHPSQTGQRWYTAGDVALILSTVMERQVPPGGDFRVYPLKEVAELTLFSLHALELLCRRDEVEHVKPGKNRGMTGRQIGLLIERYSRGGSDLADLRGPETPHEQIRRNIVKNLNRGSRRNTNIAELEEAREMSRRSARRTNRRTS